MVSFLLCLFYLSIPPYIRFILGIWSCIMLSYALQRSLRYALIFYRKESDMDDLVKLTEVMLMPNDIVSQVNFAYRVLNIVGGDRKAPDKLADALKEGFGDISIFNLL